jgi:hypothetical protein
MADKLTKAGLKYETHNLEDGAVVLFEVPPRLDWDRPVHFFCCGGRVRCEYRGTKSIRDGVALAVLGGVKA